DERDVRALFGEFDVIAEEAVIVGETQGIVRDVALAAELAVLAIAYRALVLFPRGEVLVLGDARVGHFFLAVVDNGIALVVALAVETLKPQRAVTKAAETEVKELVHRTAPERVRELGALIGMKLAAELHFDGRMIENALHYFCIPVDRDALVFLVVVVVVVVKADRQALEDRCRKLGGLDTPLLFRVAVKEITIQLATH